MNDIELLAAARPGVDDLDADTKARLFATIIDQQASGINERHARLFVEEEVAPVLLVTPHQRRKQHRSLALSAAAACVVAGGILVGVLYKSGIDTPQRITPAASPSTASSTSSTSDSVVVSNLPTTTGVATPSVQYRVGLAIFPAALVERSPEWERLVGRGIEAEIGKCMASKGFRYTPRPDGPIVVLPVIKDADYRSKYGYGDAPSPSTDAAWNTWMLQDNQPGFHAALSGSDPNAQIGGCQDVAYKAIYPPDGIAVSSDNDTYNKAAVSWFAANGVSGKTLENPNPVLAEALKDWSACMATKGVTATNPNALTVPERPAAAPWTAPPAEIALALQDWDCQESTGYINRWYGTLQTLTAQFATSQAVLIDSIHTWQNEVAARATAAIKAAP